MIVGMFLLLSVAAILIIYFWTRFSERTANDVPPFLLKIDMEAVYGTFYPEAEKHLRPRSPGFYHPH